MSVAIATVQEWIGRVETAILGAFMLFRLDHGPIGVVFGAKMAA